MKRRGFALGQFLSRFLRDLVSTDLACFTDSSFLHDHVRHPVFCTIPFCIIVFGIPFCMSHLIFRILEVVPWRLVLLPCEVVGAGQPPLSARVGITVTTVFYVPVKVVQRDSQDGKHS